MILLHDCAESSSEVATGIHQGPVDFADELGASFSAKNLTSLAHSHHSKSVKDIPFLMSVAWGHTKV
jgi:hypothetical protein